MNYIDLTCPAEIFRTALPTEEIPAATLTLYNLSDRVITSAEVMLRLLDAEGRETERLAFRGRALNGRPHSTFLLTAPCAAAPGLKSLEVTVEKVWFADNDIWRRDPAGAVAYTPNALPVSPALTRLKYAAGETAVGYPSKQDGLWVCVCGRPNPDGLPFCARCGRQMEEVFTRFSPEAVEAQVSMKERQLDLSSRNMREDTIRLQRIREEEYKQKKQRRGIRLRMLAAMVLAAGLTAGALFYGGPWLRLQSGRRALETGDYTGAKATFEALGSFGNAEEMIAECDWQIAREAAETGTSAAELTKASVMLRAFKDRPEAVEKANETDLIRARLLLGNGNWEEALEALALLPEDYEGRKELEQDCLEAKAYALQEEGQYAQAREIWQALGDRPGAREQAAFCVYEPAKALMEAEDWDGAIGMLAVIPDYKDSRERTLECHYHKAEELLDAGDTTGASNEFLLAGNWSDAKDRCMSLTYDQAEALYNAGDLRGAQPLYASIPDYKDAAWKDRSCRYTLAKAAVNDLEYTRALELLKDIPDEYEDTLSLRAEASYQKAKILLKQENWMEAVDLLKNIDRKALLKKHADAEDLYLEACKKADINPYPDAVKLEEDTSGAAPENSEESTPAETKKEEEEISPLRSAPVEMTQGEENNSSLSTLNSSLSPEDASFLVVEDDGND